MTKKDIPCAMAIWKKQFTKYRPDSFPDFWQSGQEAIESYLVQQIDQGNALVAKADQIMGYMAWMCFDFHSERSAFCPIVGHAAVEENEKETFLALYRAASQIWVQDNRFNHLLMTFNDNTHLLDMLYELGFGSYVMDACQSSSKKLLTHCPYEVTKAVLRDADALLQVANETPQFYLDAPIFLQRKAYTRDDILQIIRKEDAFLAWDDHRIIGFIDLGVQQKHHIEKLTTPESVSIGAYIKPEYRGKGVGTKLLREVFNFCHEAGKPFVHLSFETSNLGANAFWSKHFHPFIRSVRRTVNKDANHPCSHL